MKPLKVFRAHSKWIEISWPKEISREILSEQLAVRQFLDTEYAEGIKEIRMGFNTISLKLGLPITSVEAQELLDEIQQIPVPEILQKGKTWEIPVCYDLSFAKDLTKLAGLHGLATEEVVDIHSKTPYFLHFYGFLPGFMYLGGLDERLFTPRKKTPDRSMPEGTVAIGGQQTGIYPTESPGGWYAIGRTPVRTFVSGQADATMPAVGDTIFFKPITKEEFASFPNHFPPAR